MPRDIRSYFTGAQSAKTEKKVPAARTKKRRVISSDEEDEKASSPVNRLKKPKTLGHQHIPSDSNQQKKSIFPSDIFGKQPIKRQEATKISKQLQKKEIEVHEDDDFEATLVNLDTSDIEEKYLLECKRDEVTDEKKTEKHDAQESNRHNEGKKKSPDKNKKEGKSVSKKETPHTLSDDEGDEEGVESEKKKRLCNTSIADVMIEDGEQSKDKPKTKKGALKKKGVEYKVEVEVKKKASPKKVEVLDVYEERIQAKKQNSVAYQQYLQRGGATNPGSKEIPVGASYCLAGLSFVITGVLESLEKEEADELIKKYGGRTVSQVSGKTHYLIVGDQPGPLKLSKAEKFKTKKISEDDLLEMIRTRPAGKSGDVQKSQSRSKERGKQMSVDSDDTFVSPPKISKRENEEKREELRSPGKKDRIEVKELESHDKPNPPLGIKKETQIEIPPINGEKIETEALVEKYRPKTMKQILGQQGDKSNAKKLHYWLSHWHKNQNGHTKHTKPSPWAKNDDGAFFKAALLSGPPGIGKTTTVQVVCKELGFDLVEFNASDTRSKRLLKEEVSALLSNTSLKDFFTDKSRPSSNHVLLMDEVDGMAGNEDRGGLQELIALIKSSEIPVVCVCNDRNNVKMRTLSNYTFDLRFPKPRLEQIRGAMKSICFKEHIDITTEDLDRLIESTNQDIRQVINHLALFSGESCHQQRTQKKHINKDLKLGPWDVLKKVFSAEEQKDMSIHDKSDLFFHDYSIAPLFVQENYLSVLPQAPRNELMERVAQCAESLALGDMAEKAIRSSNAWSLLPMQACYSSVIPGSVMCGHIGGQINFPAWLGRNSKGNKFNRLMQEITVHARLTTGASKEAINMDYLDPLRNSIVRPLAIEGSQGIDAAVAVMIQYHLLREDLDSLIELSLWPNQRDPMQSVDSKVKAAFTRAYNKHSTAVPYAMGVAKKKGVSASHEDDGLGEEMEGEANSDDDDDNVEIDKMIKAKKPVEKKKTEAKSKNTDKPAKRGRGGKGK